MKLMIRLDTIPMDVLFRENVNLEICRNFFYLRLAREWNLIPEAVKNTRSVNAFKNA